MKLPKALNNLFFLRNHWEFIQNLPRGYNRIITTHWSPLDLSLNKYDEKILNSIFLSEAKSKPPNINAFAITHWKPLYSRKHKHNKE